MIVYILTEIYKGYDDIKVVEADVYEVNGRKYANPKSKLNPKETTDSFVYEEYEFALSLEEAKEKIIKHCNYKIKKAKLELDIFEWIRDLPIEDFDLI
jgi:hypothetical protein